MSPELAGSEHNQGRHPASQRPSSVSHSLVGPQTSSRHPLLPGRVSVGAWVAPGTPAPQAQVAGKLSLVWEGEGGLRGGVESSQWGRVPLESRAVVQGRGACTGRSCQSHLQGLWPARQVPTQQELREGNRSSAQRLLPETRGSDLGEAPAERRGELTWRGSRGFTSQESSDLGESPTRGARTHPGRASIRDVSAGAGSGDSSYRCLAEILGPLLCPGSHSGLLKGFPPLGGPGGGASALGPSPGRAGALGAGTRRARTEVWTQDQTGPQASAWDLLEETSRPAPHAISGWGRAICRPQPSLHAGCCRLLLGNARGSKLGRGSWNVLTPDLDLGVPQSPTQAGGPRHADQGRALHSLRRIPEPHGPHGALLRLLRHLQGEAATRRKAASTRPAARRRLGEGWGQSECRGVA